jgi:hypothetical protein
VALAPVTKTARIFPVLCRGQHLGEGRIEGWWKLFDTTLADIIPRGEKARPVGADKSHAANRGGGGKGTDEQVLGGGGIGAGELLGQDRGEIDGLDASGCKLGLDRVLDQADDELDLVGQKLGGAAHPGDQVDRQHQADGEQHDHRRTARQGGSDRGAQG